MPAFPGSGGGSGRGGGSSFGSGGGGGGGGYGGGGGGYGGGGYNSSGGRGRGRGSKGGKGSSKGGKGSSWGGGSSRGRGGKGGSSSQLPTKQAVLQGHTQTVTCLAVRESAKQLFSGSMDGTVRVWSWEQQFQCVHTVNAAGPVETILVFDDWLFAGTSASNGRQGVVNVWHMVNGFEQMLEGHQGAVWCLAQGGAYLFSGGDDMGVKTWQFGETQKFEPVVNLSGHTAPIQCMTATGNVLLSADRNGTVIIWDLASGQTTATIPTGHTNMLMALIVEEGYFITAALDGHIKVWDTPTPPPLPTPLPNPSPLPPSRP